MEHWWNYIDLSNLSFCLQQIPHGLAWDQTQASMVTG